MSHLACHDHGKRVSFTATGPLIITHRSDAEQCDSGIFRTGAIRLDRTELIERTNRTLPEWEDE